MADFSKKHKRNTRFSVFRSERIKLKLAEHEVSLWCKLVEVLQVRRNTGPKVETFLYLVKKYQDQNQVIKGLKRQPRFSVDRDNQIFIKVSKLEKELWEAKIKNHGGTAADCFVDMINAEFTFQDDLKIINEN